MGSEEWTDEKIQDFSNHLTAFRDKETATPPKEDDSPYTKFKNTAMIQYETFESSSGGEEASHGMFESEALSF